MKTLLTSLLFTGALLAQTPQAGADWLHYQGNLEGFRFSPLTQVTKANAGR